MLGWAGHQQQWRAGDTQVLAQLGPRENDVTAIYSGAGSPETIRALLKRYNVRYIYVGALEQQRYPAAGLAALAQYGRPVFQQDEVTIYEVLP